MTNARAVLLVGANGQLGSLLRQELQQELAMRGAGSLACTTREQLDLASADSIRRVVRDANPGIIINAAAYTAVDKAEDDVALCEAINARAPQVLAEEALQANATLVHFSTDFVFDGTKREPYSESDDPNPLNVYGRTKLGGERSILASGARAFIFRISWVYSLDRANFLTTIRRLSEERDVLTVVDDQRGVPTWAGSVAAAVGEFVTQLGANVWTEHELSQRSGIYHMGGMGSASWAELATEILRQYPLPSREHVRVTPVTTAQFPRPAVRPPYSVMASDKLARVFGIALPDWREQLQRCLRPRVT